MAQPGQPEGLSDAGAPATGLDGPLGDATAAASKANADCIFYLASPLMCKKGDKCEFRHSEAARMNPRECFFWLNQRCLKPNCPFRHPPLKGVGRNAGAQGEGTQEGEVAGAEQPEDNSAPAPYQRPLPHAQGKQGVPCIFFQRGYCAKGPYCPFLHDSAVPQPSTPAATPGTGALAGDAGAASGVPPKAEATQQGQGQEFNQQGLKRALSQGPAEGAGAGAGAGGRTGAGARAGAGAGAQPGPAQARPGDGNAAGAGSTGAASMPGEARQGGPGSGVPGGHPKAQEMAQKRARLIEAAALRAAQAGGLQGPRQGREEEQSGGQFGRGAGRGGGRGVGRGKQLAPEVHGAQGAAGQQPSARQMPGIRGAKAVAEQPAATAGSGADGSQGRGKRLRGAQPGAAAGNPANPPAASLGGNSGAVMGNPRGPVGMAPQPGSGRPGGPPGPGLNGPCAPRVLRGGAQATRVNGSQQGTPATAATAAPAGAGGGVKRRLAGAAAEAQDQSVLGRTSTGEKAAGGTEEGAGFQAPRNLSQIRAEKIQKRRLEMQENLRQQRLEQEQQQQAQQQQAEQAQQSPLRAQHGQQAQRVPRGVGVQAGSAAAQPSDGARKRTRGTPVTAPGGAESSSGGAAAAAAAGAVGAPADPALVQQSRQGTQPIGSGNNGALGAAAKPLQAGRPGPASAAARPQGQATVQAQGQAGAVPSEGGTTGSPDAVPAAGPAPGPPKEFRKPRSLQDILMEKRRARGQQKQQQQQQQQLLVQQQQQPQQQGQAQSGAEKRPVLKRIPVRPGLPSRIPQQEAATGPGAGSSAAGATEVKPGVVTTGGNTGATVAVPVQSEVNPGSGTGRPQEQNKTEATAIEPTGYSDTQNGPEVRGGEEEGEGQGQGEGEEGVGDELEGDNNEGEEAAGEEVNEDLEFNEEEYDEDEVNHEDGGLEAELEGLF